MAKERESEKWIGECNLSFHLMLCTPKSHCKNIVKWAQKMNEILKKTRWKLTEHVAKVFKSNLVSFCLQNETLIWLYHVPENLHAYAHRIIWIKKKCEERPKSIYQFKMNSHKFCDTKLGWDTVDVAIFKVMNRFCFRWACDWFDFIKWDKMPADLCQNSHGHLPTDDVAAKWFHFGFNVHVSRKRPFFYHCTYSIHSRIHF